MNLYIHISIYTDVPYIYISIYIDICLYIDI